MNDNDIFDKKFMDCINQNLNYKNKIKLIISSKFIFESRFIELFDYTDFNGKEYYSKINPIVNYHDTIISQFGDSNLFFEKIQILYFPYCYEFILKLKEHYDIIISYEGPKIYIYGDSKKFILHRFNNNIMPFKNNDIKTIYFSDINFKNYKNDNIIYIYPFFNNSSNNIFSVLNTNTICCNLDLQINYEKKESNLIYIANNIINFLTLNNKIKYPKIVLFDILAKNTIIKYKERTHLPINISKITKPTINLHLKYNKKVVILDMDNTILYRYNNNNFIIRPHLENLIKELDIMEYDIIIWTAAEEKYAKPVLESIEYLKNKQKLYINSCEFINKLYYKDLAKLNYSLDNIIIVDDQEHFFSLQIRNGYHIPGFYGNNMADNHLLKLIDIFNEINNAGSIYHVLDFYAIA